MVCIEFVYKITVKEVQHVKKILSLLLAMLMLISVLAACNNTETPQVSTGDDTSPDTPAVSGDPSADTSNDTAPESTEKTMHEVPVDTLNFANEEFLYVAIDWQGYPHYFYAEEESSDPMDAALYNRQRTIEEAIGVKISYYMYPDYFKLKDAIDQDVNMGATNIDMALIHCIDSVAAFTSGGYLYPFEELPYIDVNAPWWNKEQTDGLRLGQMTYFGVNDFMIPCPYVIFFNKEMVEDMGMDDPYRLVLDQKWTLDIFEEMARAATQDLNTDGAFTYDFDAYGIAAHDDSDHCSFITAADQPFTEKDEDGAITLAFNTEKTVDIFERFADMASADVFYPDRMVQSTRLTLDSNRLLFYLAPISEAETMRDYDVEVGILPYPKYNEEQEDYKTLDWGGLMCVPSVISNENLTGAVIELLAFESGKEVIPAYYDKVLDGQLAQDPQSVKMLDIIFDTICYEPALNYWGFSGAMGNLFFALPQQAIAKENANFASFYAEKSEAAQMVINDYLSGLALAEEFYS